MPNLIDAWYIPKDDLQEISRFKDNFKGFNATLWKVNGELELQFFGGKCFDNEISDFKEWLNSLKEI